MNNILKAVAKAYEITEIELAGRSQEANLTEARKMASYLLSKKYSKPAIAEILNRKRSGVYKGISNIKFQIKHYPNIADRYNKILSTLKELENESRETKKQKEKS